MGMPQETCLNVDIALPILISTKYPGIVNQNLVNSTFIFFEIKLLVVISYSCKTHFIDIKVGMVGDFAPMQVVKLATIVQNTR